MHAPVELDPREEIRNKRSERVRACNLFVIFVSTAVCRTHAALFRQSFVYFITQCGVRTATSGARPSSNRCCTNAGNIACAVPGTRRDAGGGIGNRLLLRRNQDVVCQGRRASTRFCSALSTLMPISHTFLSVSVSFCWSATAKAKRTKMPRGVTRSTQN